MAAAPEYFAAEPTDSDIFAVARIASLHREELDDRTIFLFGASSLMSALTSVEELRAVLGEAGAGNVRIVDLMTDGQSIGQTIALARLLPARFDGVVLIEVNPRSLSGSTEGPSLRVARVVEERWPGAYLWGNRQFFMPRLLPALRNLTLDRPVERASFPWLHRNEPLGSEAWSRLADALRVHVRDNYDLRLEPNLAEYADLVRDLRTRGDVHVVFLEALAPSRTRIEVLGEDLWKRHVARMARFAAETGVRYWNPTEETDLSDHDFFDYTHLFRQGARERFTRFFGSRLARFVSEVQS